MLKKYNSTPEEALFGEKANSFLFSCCHATHHTLDLMFVVGERDSTSRVCLYVYLPVGCKKPLLMAMVTRTPQFEVGSFSAP